MDRSRFAERRVGFLFWRGQTVAGPRTARAGKKKPAKLAG